VSPSSLSRGAAARTGNFYLHREGKYMNTAEMPPLMGALIESLDLDDFEDLATAELVLLHPKTKAKTTSTITLASAEHPARKNLDLARTRRLRAEFNATGKMPTRDPVEDIEDQTDYLVAATLGWNLTQGGKPLEFSPAAARKLYTDPKKRWVRAQALEAINKNELFIAASAKA
jgi:hypothetical protein